MANEIQGQNYTDRIYVQNAYKDENGKVHIRGTFCGGIHFPKDNALPFEEVERNLPSGKKIKQVRCTIVISPDDKKNEKGYPYASVFIKSADKSGKSMTFAEALAENGVALADNGKLYVSVYMDRNVDGLYELLGKADLSYKDHVKVCGEMSLYAGKDGNMRASIGSVTTFELDHVKSDKVEPANRNKWLKLLGPTVPSGTSSFVDIDEEGDGELPF